mgnify:CR=1 FL=1
MERYWRDKTVIPYLKSNGFEILKPTRIKAKEFNQEADILAVKFGALYIMELKFMLGNHALQTGIGQLLIHQFLNRNMDNTYYHSTKYWLVLPQDLKQEKHFSPAFLNYLLTLHIETQFI